MYYNPYEILNKNGIFYMPSIKMSKSDSDDVVFWDISSSRLDSLSQTYYGNPYGGFLILLANGKINESDFVQNEKVIIPLTYKARVEEFTEKINQFIKYNK